MFPSHRHRFVFVPSDQHFPWHRFDAVAWLAAGLFAVWLTRGGSSVSSLLSVGGVMLTREVFR
jgi:hypothetical protein